MAGPTMIERWREEVASWGTIRAVLLAWVVGVAAWYVALGAAHPWDFETYYYAAAAYRLGLDPYNVRSLGAVAGCQVDLPFLYAPITLLTFLPITYLPLPAAGALWLALKCATLIALLWVWWRVFLPSTSLPIIIVVTLLGFNLALLWDLRTGNVALMEELFLWLAFAAYVRGIRWATVCLIVAASIFKIYPILLLAMILLPVGTHRGDSRLFGLGLLVFVGLIALPMPGADGWWAVLAGSVGADRPALAVNSSALGILDALLAGLSVPTSIVAWLGPLLYIAYCATLIFLSGPLLFRAVRSQDPVALVGAVVLVWMLAAPRLMIYSYVMAIVPALSTIRARIRSSSGQAIAVALILVPGGLRLLPGDPPTVAAALPFLLLVWLWVLAGSSMRASSAGRPSGDGSRSG